MHSMTITPEQSGLHYISLDTWYNRMYRRGCTSGLTIIRFRIKDQETGEWVGRKMYYDQWGSRTFQKNLEAGKEYLVLIEIDWHFGIRSNSKVYREFSLSV